MSGAATSSTMPRSQVLPQKRVNQRPTMALLSCSTDMRVFLVESERVMGSRVVNKCAENDPFLAAESSDEAQLSVAKTVALGTAQEAFADLVDVAQRRARCRWHSRKVNDLDADNRQALRLASAYSLALPSCETP